MRKILNGAFTALMIGIVSLSAASAADLIRKAPGQAIVSDWGGFYAGGNVGYGFGRAENTFGLAQPTFAGPDSLLSGSDSGSLNGLIAGGQFGYNLQIKNYVLGVEADFQGSGQKRSGIFNGGVNTVGLVGTNAATVTYSEKLSWLSTVRGRLGVTDGPWLMYATGGLAIGQIKSDGIFAFADAANGPNAPGAWSQSSTKVGWVIGAGVENKLSRTWSWKAEYLYVNLGNVTGTAVIPAGNCYGTPGGCFNSSGPGTGTMTTKFTDHIVRLGLNYKFAN